MERRLIDVSEHNGVIDWATVKASGIDGVIIRCGYGSNIDSQDDKKWRQNVEGCILNGIPFGVYLYSYAKTNEMAVSEAAHVLRLVEPYKDKLSYPVYYDLEEENTKNGAVDRARAFAKVMTDAGYTVGIYANQNWWDNYLIGLDEFTKWVAKYGSNNGTPQTAPTVNGTDIWQYTSVGHVDGISTKVDMNICYKDFGVQNSTATSSKPVSNAKEIVRQGQVHANNFANCGIVADGIRGKDTKKAGQKVLQRALNCDYNSGLTEDGYFQTKSKKAFGSHYVKQGETQYLVTALEILLMLKGYDPHGVECPGVFGSSLAECVEQYQKDNGLKVDKIAGYNTFMSLIS